MERKQKIVRKDKREIITVSESAAILFLKRNAAKYGRIEDVKIDRGAPNEVVEMFNDAIAYNEMTAEEQAEIDNVGEIVGTEETVQDNNENDNDGGENEETDEERKEREAKEERNRKDRERRAKKKAEKEAAEAAEAEKQNEKGEE